MLKEKRKKRNQVLSLMVEVLRIENGNLTNEKEKVVETGEL